MPTSSDVQRKIREFLQDHYGLITRIEARQLGASDDYIRHKLASGAWVAVHRGVLRDTHFPRSYYQDVRAAVLACERVGRVSHQSAGWLLDLMEDEPDSVVLSIPIASRRGLRLQGVTIHRSSDLHLSEPTTVRGLPVTNALRTIVDLASVLAPNELQKVVDTALRRKTVTVAGLEAELDRLRRRGRPGIGTLRRHLLDRGFIGTPPASALESLMRQLIVAAGLPMPRVEVHVGPDGEYRLDFAWVEIRFAVEVDGYMWHFTPEHMQHDTARRNTLQDQGWSIRVYTWRDLTQSPERVTREIRDNYYRLAAATC